MDQNMQKTINAFIASKNVYAYPLHNRHQADSLLPLWPDVLNHLRSYTVEIATLILLKEI